MTRIAVFGYGSLVSRESAELTLGREISGEPVLVTLAGWRRRWSQARDNNRSEKTFAPRDGGPIPQFVLGLNVERTAGVEKLSDSENNSTLGANGVLIEVTEAELERLDVREIRYDRLDVTDAVLPVLPFDRVVTYVAKPEQYARTPPPGAVVLSTYVAAVERAFASLGAEQLELYRLTTDPPGVEAIDGILVRDEIPPGNPRAW